MGQIVAAGINSAASLAAASMNYDAQIATNKNNLQISREVNQANRNLAQDQNQWNIDQWNREIAYNDPKSQVQRLKNAGLSDAAAAQIVDGGSAPHLESADLANQVAPEPLQASQFDISAIPSVLGIMREIINLRKDKASASIEEEKASHASDLILTPLDAQKVSTKLQLQQYEFLAKSNPYSLRKLAYETKAAKSLPEIQKWTSEQAKVNYKLALQNYGFLKEWNPKKLHELGETINSIIAKTAKDRQDISESKSRQSLIGSQIENVKQDTENKKLENEGFSLDNESKKISNVLNKFGAPEDISLKIGALISSEVLKPEDTERYLWNIHDYISSGGKIFQGSQDMRAIFLNSIAPGIGKDNQLPVWTRGTFRHLLFPFFGGDDGTSGLPLEQKPKSVPRYWLR